MGSDAEHPFPAGGLTRRDLVQGAAAAAARALHPGAAGAVQDQDRAAVRSRIPGQFLYSLA